MAAARDKQWSTSSVTKVIDQIAAVTCAHGKRSPSRETAAASIRPSSAGALLTAPASRVGSVCVEISDAGRRKMADDNVSKQKNDISFGLGELVRQMDKVQQAT